MATINGGQLQKPRLRIDLFRPAFFLLAAVLILLILLPLSWLVYYSFVDKEGAFTLVNFVNLITDPTLMEPFLRSLYMSAGVGALCCLVATPLAWLSARTDLPGRRLLRALVMASFASPAQTVWLMALVGALSSVLFVATLARRPGAARSA